MDIQIFTQILRDKHFPDYKKLRYKYPSDFDAFLQALAALYERPLPLPDFDGAPLVLIESCAAVPQAAVKRLMQPQSQQFGVQAAENEIVATSAIEQIDFSRDSVRKILNGMAPRDSQETRILGIKRGLEFISNPAHRITEANLDQLYRMTVGDFLPPGEKSSGSSPYRDDAVFVVSDRVEHTGLDYRKIPAHMQALIAFIQSADDLNDLVKAAIIHFYIAFVHPYFDGNGRMARLVHLWFLIQKGYQSALFLPFSSQIEKSRKAYYDAFTMVEENRKFSGKIDVTPFVMYCAHCVYGKMGTDGTADTLSAYHAAAQSGQVTEKESQLWQFVLSHYGTDEFSTKQLERDFGAAAYATIRSFVRKFESLALLGAVRYGTRVKYWVRHDGD